MVKLGINIDHVATVRQARLGKEPDPVRAAVLAELGGADGITVHLREDRRHIQDRDVEILKETISTRLNFEMACTDEMVKKAVEIMPYTCCLVPEKREELTTEGGLDVISNFEKIKDVVERLNEAGIMVSIFIDPSEKQIDKAWETGAKFIELHTGAYADSKGMGRREELAKIVHAAQFAREQGFLVNAGHGLDYENVSDIVSIPGIYEVNIGHSIIGRSLFTGLERAVREMKETIDKAVLHAGM